MRKSANAGLTRPLFVNILLDIIIFASPSATAEDRFKMSVSVGPPLYFEEQDGFFDSLTAEIFKRLKTEYELTWLPAQRSLIYTDNGTYDGHIARTAAVEARFPNLIRVPVNVFDFEFMVFARNPDLQINGWEGLVPYSVGMINGWKIVEQNTVGAKSVAKANDYGQLLSMLNRNRVDVAVLDRVMGGWKLKQLGYDISILEPAIESKPNFIYLHKKHAELVPRMAGVIEAMKQDGTFEAIYTRTLLAR